MSYYTTYTMEVKGVDTIDKSKIDQLTNALSDRGIVGYVFDEEPWSDSHGVLFYFGNDMVKWEVADDDIKLVSMLFPHYTFKLSGVGEEPDDRWDTYYKDGKMEYCPWIPKKPERIKW